MRSLNIVNGLPPRPTRTCLKKIGVAQFDTGQLFVSIHLKDRNVCLRITSDDLCPDGEFVARQYNGYVICAYRLFSENDNMLIRNDISVIRDNESCT